jgi:hypothetical protein
MADVKDVEHKTKEALSKKQKVQKMADQWINEKEGIINEIRQMKNQIRWYEFQTKKFTRYVEEKRKTISKLKEEKQELKKMQLQLEPYLEDKIAQLESFIQEDLQFQTSSRSSYINYLRESLYDPDLSLPEKMRRVIKAYHREAKYGQSIAVEQRELEIKGSTFKADILRLGRLKLFYASLDSKHIGAWDGQEEEWEAIDNSYKRAIHKTIDIAKQQKTVELVTLPVGGPKE